MHLLVAILKVYQLLTIIHTSAMKERMLLFMMIRSITELSYYLAARIRLFQMMLMLFFHLHSVMLTNSPTLIFLNHSKKSAAMHSMDANRSKILRLMTV